MKLNHTLFYGDRANCDHHPDPQEILQYIYIVLHHLDHHEQLAYDYIIAKERGGKNGTEHWQIVVHTSIDYATIKPNSLRNAKLKFKWKSSAQNSTSMFTVMRQLSDVDPLFEEKTSYPLKEYAGLYSDTSPYFANEDIITSYDAAYINDLMRAQREDFIPYYAKPQEKLSPYQLFNNAFEKYLEKHAYTLFHHNGAYAFDTPAGIEYITNFILEYYHLQRCFFDYSKFTRQMNCVLNNYDRTALSLNLSKRFLKDNKYLWDVDAYNPDNLKCLP